MVGEISNSEMRGKNVTKGMFDIHYSLKEEEGDCREQSRREKLQRRISRSDVAETEES
jgi:hypothetical protein